MPISVTEAQLLARCRGGDPESFRQILQEHHQRVYRTVYAVTADPVAASDLTQETFIKAWRALPGFRGDAALSTWLTRLALNTAHDYLRRQHTAARFHALWAFRSRHSSGRDMAQDIADRDAVRHAVGHLSQRAQQVVALRYGLGLSMREIAETLNCSEGTVKSRLNAASTKLRAALRREWDDSSYGISGGRAK